MRLAVYGTFLKQEFFWKVLGEVRIPNYQFGILKGQIYILTDEEEPNKIIEYPGFLPTGNQKIICKIYDLSEERIQILDKVEWCLKPPEKGLYTREEITVQLLVGGVITANVYILNLDLAHKIRTIHIKCLEEAHYVYWPYYL